MNKTLLTALKKKLEGAKGKRVDELPKLLWEYRTTSRRLIGAILFALAHGMEVVIPTEIGMSTTKMVM